MIPYKVYRIWLRCKKWNLPLSVSCVSGIYSFGFKGILVNRLLLYFNEFSFTSFMVKGMSMLVRPSYFQQSTVSRHYNISRAFRATSPPTSILCVIPKPEGVFFVHVECFSIYQCYKFKVCNKNIYLQEKKKKYVDRTTYVPWRSTKGTALHSKNKSWNRQKLHQVIQISAFTWNRNIRSKLRLVCEI